MKLFLYLFYHSVRNLALFSFRIFYRKTVILQKEKWKIKQPTILVSNHPSTMTDPINVAGRFGDTMVHFLANASMFKHWFTNWFFNTFYCIPIERPKDVGGRKISNADSFAKCDAFLSGGGCLYIAPEGVSNLERRLQELKTGTARIALSAEAKNNFQLGLQILPVGLSYSAPTDFRSDVLMNIGEGIVVKPYEQAYAEDPVATVRRLTADLEKAMEALILHTADKTEDVLLAHIESIQQAAEPLEVSAHFFRTQQTLEQLQALRKTAAPTFQKLVEETKTLAETLVKNNTNQVALYAASKNNLAAEKNKNSATLLLGFPLFIFGYINHFLANYIPGLLARKIKIYRGYQSTIKLFSGLVFYPLFYFSQAALVHHFFGEWWITLLYLLLLYPLALFTWSYLNRWSLWRAARQLEQWKKTAIEEVQKWIGVQQNILDHFRKK